MFREISGRTRLSLASLDDREFIAAKSREKFMFGQACPDAARGLDENGVTDGMAMQIVDCLETVEIETEECNGRRGAGLLQRAVEVLNERQSIADTGQRIVRSQMGYPGCR